MPKPTADWVRVGDKFYRKILLYSKVFDSDLDIANHIVSGAPYSGAVAFFRDDQKLQTYRSSQGTKSSIDVYSYAGNLIRKIDWNQGPIKGLGWSEDEKLIIVGVDGSVRCYSDLHGDFVPFSLGHGAEEYGVISCRFWLSGFVALLGNNTLVSVSKYHEPRPKLLAKPPETHVSSWTLIPPSQTLSRSEEVLLAINETVYVVDPTECEDRQINRGPFKHISISPNGKFVALLTDDGKVLVASSDFQSMLSEYDSKFSTPPKDLKWCGNNAVVLAWEDEIHLIGPNGASTKFYYDGWVQTISDVDGIRVITNELCEFIQKVPDVTGEVFMLASSSPASVLLDAIDQLEQKSPKADEDIQIIRPQLSEAVDTCIKAAGHEYSIHWQKQLLKAASFGKSVLDFYNSDDFVDMCEVLRVLNAVRFFEIGMPLSYDQYIQLTPERLVDRLLSRHEYLLAIRISEYLSLSSDRIFVHWASRKVRVSSDDDESICRLIVQKLKGKRGISFEEIARSAFEEGRSKLATELLNYDPRAGKQVPLLLSMKEESLALDKAIESGDTDLIFHVLLNLKKKLPLASFFRMITSRPLASALVESSARDTDQEMLKDLFYQDDRRSDGFNLLLMEALEQKDFAGINDKFKIASKLLQGSKDSAFQLKAIEESQKLLKLQDTFRKETDQDLTGQSVNETIFNLILAGHSKRAFKVQTEFKVPEKTAWWVRLRALVAKRDWNELEEISKIKKSPIGWEPFFNEVLSAGNTRLASVFIPKCTSLPSTDRIEMWVKCGMVVRAGEEALKAKDMNSLAELKIKATGNAVQELERMIAQLAPLRRA